MQIPDIGNLRLANQQVSKSRFASIGELVGWMGGIQAQDYAMAKWALGIRLPGFTDDMVEMALGSGEVFRTHVLRPTWHLVARDDLRWMLQLTAPRIIASMNARHKQLELSGKLLAKCNTLLEKTLSGGLSLTREELMTMLRQNGIETNKNRSSHILMWAELHAIICSGTSSGKRPTYALVEERVPRSKPLHKEEALATLAHRYFNSHGPATLQDFVWWSGLQVSDARNGLEMVKPMLDSMEAGSDVYWFKNGKGNKIRSDAVYLLPAYDEFLISYRDRSAVLSLSDHTRAVSDNGLFRPVIVLGSQVAGIWKRTVEKNTMLIEMQPFDGDPMEQFASGILFDAAVEKFRKFISPEIRIKVIVSKNAVS